ncbi:MAG: DnaJ C-terminal domain-containing protein [Candidatus Methylomirabilia bacterium]
MRLTTMPGIAYKDYYKILGVDRTAGEKAVKQAYRRLARKYHPDVNKSEQAAERFKEINEAHEVLSDPEKRRRYDTLGPDWQRVAQAGWAGGQGPFEGLHVRFGRDVADLGDFSDFFKSIFSDLGVRGGRPPFVDLGEQLGWGRRAERTRRENIEASIDISLEEAFGGSRKSIDFDLEEPCPTCGGSGHQAGRPCRGCFGRGWHKARRHLEVKIPPGVSDGSKVRVAREGARATGGARPGDLYLLVRMKPHPIFERKGYDLHVELPITVPEAALGAEVEVPTLKGKVTMKIPAGTGSGRTFRLRGYGMPHLKGGRAGDQLVKIKVVMPSGLTARERALFEELQRLRPENPRAHLVK